MSNRSKSLAQSKSNIIKALDAHVIGTTVRSFARHGLLRAHVELMNKRAGGRPVTRKQ